MSKLNRSDWLTFSKQPLYAIHKCTIPSIFVLTKMRTIGRKREKSITRAVVVAQLVERSLPITEVCGSNTVIGKKNYIEHLTVLEPRTSVIGSDHSTNCQHY